MTRKWFAFLPNLISLGRLILVPVSVDMIASRRWPEALAIFLVAGVSDALDGWIARRFDLRSELGAYLDAIADKALLVCDYVTLPIVGILPLWLALIVVSRDLMIIGAVILSGCSIARWKSSRCGFPRPTPSGRSASSRRCWRLWRSVCRSAAGRPRAQWAVTALTLASLAAYFRRWVTHMSA